jgi:hypothetical protein
MVEPLHFSFEVNCSVEHAFEIWTKRIDTWWPRSHTISSDPNARVTLEPFVGGRIFERTPAGVEHEWGEVVSFEPARRLTYLWHIRRDRADATEVEITFASTHKGSTRIEIEHRGWERLGEDAHAWRDRNNKAWAGLLPCYLGAASGAPTID